MLTADHWQYLHGKPESTGKLKVHNDDFIVREVLGYEPCGEGEHIYLWCRKTGLNTAFVAEQIAKFCQLPLRAVTYAGRKDKHAVTEQWIGVHQPGKTEFDWQALQLEGLEIVSAKRHNKKLRTGVLKGNRFELVLRDITQPQAMETRLAAIQAQGVPNYFGQQRFGDSKYHPGGSNLALAEKLLDGEQIRNRNKRSMAISALRSWLFNEFASQRIEAGAYDKLHPGDPLNLTGSNSFFVAQELDQTLQQRLASGDVQITAPMWGRGQLASQNQAHDWERQIAERYPVITRALEELGLKQERRTISLKPEKMQWKFIDEGVRISFELPSGSFATSVVRELMSVQPNGENT